MKVRIELEISFHLETDGRWIADIADIPGCTVYGDTKSESIRKVLELALSVMADRIEHGESLGGESM